jgi:hypothetical protein
MDKKTQAQINKIRSDYDALAQALWGVPVDFDAAFFDLDELDDKLGSIGFTICETVQRDPIPKVEYQSIRGYIYARRPIR